MVGSGDGARNAHEARLSQQKRVAAMLPKQSEPARKLREKTRNNDVLSVTETAVSSASSSASSDGAKRRRMERCDGCDCSVSRCIC